MNGANMKNLVVCDGTIMDLLATTNFLSIYGTQTSSNVFTRSRPRFLRSRHLHKLYFFVSF